MHPEQVLRPLNRVLQRAIRLVDARRRLEREALFHVGAAGKAVGVHFGLQLAIGAVKHRSVETECAG